MTDLERLLSKVDRSDGCWRWLGANNGTYGYFWLRGRTVPAHRASYILHVRPLERNEDVHHDLACTTKLCVNPAHLSPLPRSEHIRVEHDARLTCNHGHQRTPENTYVRPSGTRECRQCRREQQRPKEVSAA